MTLPASANSLKNSLEPGAWFWRFDILLPDGVTYFRCVDNTQTVTVNGVDYVPCPVKISEIENASGGGEVPNPNIQLTNLEITDIIKDYLADYSGLRGSVLTMTRVIAEEPNLDMSNTAQVYDVLNYGRGAAGIILYLGSERLQSQPIPWTQYDPYMCPFPKTSGYKGPECKAVAVQTTCSGSYDDCRDRNNAVNYGGEVGLNDSATRYA